MFFGFFFFFSIGRCKILMVVVLFWNVFGFVFSWVLDIISFIILEFIVVVV